VLIFEIAGLVTAVSRCWCSLVRLFALFECIGEP